MAGRREIGYAVIGFVTLVTAFAVVAAGVNATDALVLSQVVLSIALPVPMIALLIFATRRDIMGEFAVGPVTRVLAGMGAAAVLGLNFVLLAAFFGLEVPFLAG